MPVIQNVSLAAGDDVTLTFNIDDDTPIDLSGAEVTWAVYAQEYGVPSGDAVINKSSLSGGGIEIPGSPADIFSVSVLGSDTKSLLRNYYHEAFVKDVNGNKITITVGIITVTPTQIASAQ